MIQINNLGYYVEPYKVKTAIGIFIKVPLKLLKIKICTEELIRNKTQM